MYQAGRACALLTVSDTGGRAMKSRATVRTVTASVILSGILAVTAASIVAHGTSSGRQTVNVRSAATIIPDPVTDPGTVTLTPPSVATPPSVPTPDLTTTTAPPDTTPVAAPPVSVAVPSIPHPVYVPPTVMAQGVVPNRAPAAVPATTVVTEAAPPPTVWVTVPAQVVARPPVTRPKGG